MASRAFQSIEDIPLYEPADASNSCAPVEFYAGERICPPGSLPRRRPVRRYLKLATTTAACAWAWVSVPEDMRWHALETIERAIATRIAMNSAPGGVAPAMDPEEIAALAAPQAAPPLPEARQIAEAPAEKAGVPAPEPAATEPSKPASQDPPAMEKQEEAPPPLPPPVVDPADPYQQRALAAGLHPDLPRVVLKTLSEVDFRNAKAAIKSALADTPFDGVHAAPKGGGGAKLALFEVRFVRGSDPTCRRYVVTVTKNRWSTTAPPMEQCGSKPRWAGAGAAG